MSQPPYSSVSVFFCCSTKTLFVISHLLSHNILSPLSLHITCTFTSFFTLGFINQLSTWLSAILPCFALPQKGTEVTQDRHLPLLWTDYVCTDNAATGNQCEEFLMVCCFAHTYLHTHAPTYTQFPLLPRSNSTLWIKLSLTSYISDIMSFGPDKCLCDMSPLCSTQSSNKSISQCEHQSAGT